MSIGLVPIFTMQARNSMSRQSADGF